MKNITLSIDEDVLERARVVAAERKTTINALVRSYLSGLLAKERAIDEARAKLLELAHEKAGDLGDKSLKREDLYDR